MTPLSIWMSTKERNTSKSPFSFEPSHSFPRAQFSSHSRGSNDFDYFNIFDYFMNERITTQAKWNILMRSEIFLLPFMDCDEKPIKPLFSSANVRNSIKVLALSMWRARWLIWGVIKVVNLLFFWISCRPVESCFLVQRFHVQHFLCVRQLKQISSNFTSKWTFYVAHSCLRLESTHGLVEHFSFPPHKAALFFHRLKSENSIKALRSLRIAIRVFIFYALNEWNWIWQLTIIQFFYTIQCL